MLNYDNYSVLTFDCYGTLIDWETGIWQALQPILNTHNVRISADKALELYGELEAEVEAGAYRQYKDVLWVVLERLGTRLGFGPTKSELEHFSVSVKDWPAFPDSARALKALATKYKLAIVSNIDNDLFAHSAQKLEAPFDWVITAEQVKSYKPAPAHFYEAFERTGLPRTKILHVAQSLFHDIGVAKSLGLSTVWVNRRHAQGGSGATPPAAATPDVEVPDMATLARLTGTMT